MGFMRKLRAFEKVHNRCAPAARQANIETVTAAVIKNAKRTASAH